MNKQNLFVITNNRNRLPLDKSLIKPKSTDNLLLRSQQSRQFKKNKDSQCSPIKKNSTSFPQDTKKKQSNYDRPSLKVNTKFPMKLRIISRPENDERSRSSQYNTPKLKPFNPDLRVILEDNLVNQLLQNDLVYKTRVNQLIIKPEVFTSVIEKIIVACFNNDQPESNQDQLDCLTYFLRRLRHLVALMMAEARGRNFSLCQNFKVSNLNNNYFHGIKVVQSELGHLYSQKSSLVEELKDLCSQKQAIALYNQQKKQQIQGKNQQLIEILRETDKLKQEQTYLMRQVQRLKAVLSKCQTDYDQIINYVAVQTKNKHVQQASEVYKNIESQIYEYAVYLQANELASSETYQSIPFKNQCFVINNLEKSLKEVNKEIIHNEELSIVQKGVLMRNFVLQAHQQYKKKDEECQRLLEFKTKCIRKFVDMMKMWLDNWSLKQEYLMNLRKQFTIDSQAFLDQMESFFHEKLCPQCCQTVKSDYLSIMDHYHAIEENYKLGNSFY